jgi:hypothetical protein
VHAIREMAVTTFLEFSALLVKLLSHALFSQNARESEREIEKIRQRIKDRKKDLVVTKDWEPGKPVAKAEQIVRFTVYGCGGHCMMNLCA